MEAWITYIVAPLLIVGGYLYMKFYRNTGLRREVMLLRPNDGRFTTLPIERETDEGLYCKIRDGIKYVFYKTGPGWTERIVRFLAVEGTPLVSWVKAGDDVKTTISEFLKFKWGEKVYNKLSDELRKPLEEGTGVIVTVDPIIPDKSFGLDRVSADAILKESDRANLDEFGKGTPKKEGMKDFMTDAIKFLTGAFAMYFLIRQGYL